MPELDEPPSAMLRRLVDGFQISQAIHVAAELGIADLLASGPQTAEDLAANTDSHPEALYRLLRALASVGVFEEGAEGKFQLTPVGACLRSDAPQPVGQWARWIGRAHYWETWGKLLHSVRTGETAFPAFHDGQSVWEWRAARPEEAASFDRAMEGLSRRQSQALLDAYDFGRFSMVVDVGGGNGSFMAALLERHPQVRGTVFDQPHVVAGARDVLEAAGVHERCEVVGGNFFESVPAGADAYVLKAVLHDWEDGECLQILEQVRRACRPRSKLLVLEWVVGPPNGDPRSKFSDLNMLVMPGGRERTEPEWRVLFDDGGFRLREIFTGGLGQSVIEGTPR